MKATLDVLHMNRIVAFVLFGVVVLLGFYYIWQPKDNEVVPPAELTISLDGYIGSQPLEIVARNATLVFEGTVTQSGTPIWTTEDGRRPDMTAREIVLDPSVAIVTPYYVTIERVLKGNIESSGFTYFQAGGKVGSDEMTINEDLRWVEEGMRAIFFFEKRDLEHVIVNPYKLLDRYIIEPDRTQVIGRTRVSTLDTIESVLHHLK